MVDLRSLGKLYCKVINAYLHVGVSIVFVSIFKVGCLRHFSFTLVTKHLALFWYRFTMEINDSSSAEKDCLGDRPVAGTSQSVFNRKLTTAESSGRSNQTQSRTAESPLVQHVFNMFKSYLEVKLEEKGKEIEGKSETDKQVGQLRFQGNQTQFEHNAKLDSVLDRIRAETDGHNVAVSELIRKERN